MISALWNRLKRLETRERQLKPSHAPFVVAVAREDGSVEAAWVATLERGVSREYRGAAADAKWRELNGEPHPETVREMGRIRDLMKSDPAAVTATERQFVAETMKRYPAR